MHLSTISVFHCSSVSSFCWTGDLLGLGIDKISVIIVQS